MSDVAEAEKSPRAGLLKPMVLGLAGAILLGAGGWFAAHSGLLGSLGLTAGMGGGGTFEAAEVSFVPVPQMVISLGPESPHRHLRFGATLEVARGRHGQAEELMPRVVDVLNSYLRAIDVAAFEEPAALFRLRAQMLRRVQLVTGEGVVRDLLITEFVFN